MNNDTERKKLVATWECVVTQTDGDTVFCDAYLLGENFDLTELWEVLVPGNSWTEGYVFYVLKSNNANDKQRNESN